MYCTASYCFSNVPIFKQLAQEDMDFVKSLIVREHYDKGARIISAGAQQRKLFVVRSGKVKIIKLLADGCEQIVRIVETNEYFGETELFQEGPLTVDIEALERTELCMIDGDVLKQFLLARPQMMMQMLSQLSKRIEKMEHTLSIISRKEVDARVADYLLQQMYQQNSTTFFLPLAKKDIAALLGTTRESVSRKLSLFQKNNWLTLDGQCVTIIDHNALQQIAIR